MVERVLVAMDESPLAERALVYALDAFPDAAITVVHVAFLEYDMTTEETDEVVEVRPDALDGVGDEVARRVFERIRAITDDDADVSVTFLTGDPAERILEYVEEGGFDQLVVGTHARDGVSRLLIGSVAETVARKSRVPTTLVK